MPTIQTFKATVAACAPGTLRRRLARLLALLTLASFCAGVGAALSEKDLACIKCHKELGANKVLHQPMKKGCVNCHEATDASTTPHKSTGGFKKGLVAKVADHCYDCHEKEAHAKKSKHTALGKCTACHDAHSSKHEKLLLEPPAALCFSCHEKADFEGKSRHDPAIEGECLSCHDAHASDHKPLLSEPATKVCLDCHKKVTKVPHAASGFSVSRAKSGHPTGGEKPGVMDPARPEEPFYCGSCHDPHRSEHAKLMRFDQRSPMAFCQKCHKI